MCKDYPEPSDDTKLCSVVKKADVVVYDFIKTVLDSGFDGKGRSYGIADGAIDICDAGGNIPDGVREEVDRYRKKIEKGELKVPYDWQTCSDYVNSLAGEK